MSELELCPTCKKGKFRATEEVSSTRELVCDYCGQKCSNAGVNEYL
jgi:DNA-directed RNA polymerase subunit RPC12/RpoP